MDRLLESVKKHEGYRNKVYLDTLGKRTVGVGHLCVEDFWEDDKEYEEKFLMDILLDDLQNAIKGARELKEEHDCTDIDEIAQEIIVEMVFQLGKNGVSKAVCDRVGFVVEKGAGKIWSSVDGQAPFCLAFLGLGQALETLL